MMKMLVLIKLMMSALSTIPISSTMLIIMNDRSNHQSYVTRVQSYVTRVLLKSDTAINIHDLVSKSRKSKSTYQREWYKKTNPRVEESLE